MLGFPVLSLSCLIVKGKMMVMYPTPHTAWCQPWIKIFPLLEAFLRSSYNLLLKWFKWYPHNQTAWGFINRVLTLTKNRGNSIANITWWKARHDCLSDLCLLFAKGHHFQSRRGWNHWLIHGRNFVLLLTQNWPWSPNERFVHQV